MNTATGEFRRNEEILGADKMGFLTTQKYLTPEEWELLRANKLLQMEGRTQSVEEMRSLLHQMIELKKTPIVTVDEVYEFSNYNTSLSCYGCTARELRLFLYGLRYFPLSSVENGLRTVRITISSAPGGKTSSDEEGLRPELEFAKNSHDLVIPILIEPVNQAPVVSMSCLAPQLQVSDAELANLKSDIDERGGYQDPEPYYNRSFAFNSTYAKLRAQPGVPERYVGSLKAAQERYAFLVDGNSVEVPLCLNLTDDAVEHPGNYMELTVGTSSGMKLFKGGVDCSSR